MKKRIVDCSFKEFKKYLNDISNSCDELEKLDKRIKYNYIVAVCEVNRVRPLFFKTKAREKKWDEIKFKYFKPDTVIDV